MGADPVEILGSEAQSRLLDWFATHQRDLPWRKTRDPYAIWVSEVMLQQTQVATVEPYWRRWMERFPNPAALATATDEEILAHWQGLGYYRRCRMLVAGAKHVEANGIPQTVDEWRLVPGIGPYSAGAIGSIAQNLPSPLVDGNVERVYSRLTADPSPGPALTKRAWNWAKANLATRSPGDWNQALMELGATVCTPTSPQCGRCPLAECCRARAEDAVNRYPAKPPKKKAVELTHETWIPRSGNLFGIEQIPKGEWWEDMWQFPRADCKSHSRLRAVLPNGEPRLLGVVRHTVTNHRIALQVYEIECADQVALLRWVTRSELDQVALPSPQRKALALVDGPQPALPLNE